MLVKLVLAVVVRLVFLFLRRLAPWARYLYFMRFAILLWAFPLVLRWANETGARSLVSGIITPSQGPQYLCVAFFLVSSSFVALILARVVVINGGERFGSPCPPLLEQILADERSIYFQWLAPIAAQLNTIIVFLYLRSNGGKEGVDRSQIDLGFAIGAGCALLFWYIVNAIYYLTYRPEAGSSKIAAQIGRAAAATLLFPRSWLCLSRNANGDAPGDVLEAAELRVSLKWVARFVQVPGYRWPPHGDLYEGHYLSLLALLGLLALYLTLWPLTAPVPVEGWSRFAVIAYLLSGALLAVAVVTASIEEPKEEELEKLPDDEANKARGKYARQLRRLWGWKISLTILILLFGAVIPTLYYKEDAERFPILALLLILAIAGSWALAGVAFFADRYRVPVLTAFLVLAVVPRMLHWDAGKEEHYLSTTLSSAQVDLPTPGDILKAKSHDQPLIIVTATGGGIHAAAWTTAVLAQLEKEFANHGTHAVFHDHLLLLSTVSGGSSGLYAYLRELKTVQGNGTPNWERMNTASSCSGLEAIGWGLVYHDIPKAFIPFFPYLTVPSPGVDDLFETPLGKDRTWALRRAFERNLNDPFCAIESKSDGRISLKELEAAEDGYKDHRSELTLASLAAEDGKFPAFTMNTTSVEDGARFLLANYRIPDDVSPEGAGPVYKARSFLATFMQDKQNPGKRPDLPLAAAAQMSATFPYVSSQARMPLAVDDATDSVHFTDGGYYDNDGTASAIEFLRYALSQSGKENPNAKGKVRILLIEIRNSDEIAGGEPDQRSDHTFDADGNALPLWNSLDQIEGPPAGFWNAGHQSVTARDQAGLELFERAYGSQVEVHTIVIGDNCARSWDKTDPLNWLLTPVQKQEVAHTSSQEAAMLKRYEKAKEWFDKPEDDWKNASSVDDSLQRADCSAVH
jgi:hypothetical protein